jgi:DNA-directed RNA polymerase subunit H (RpoH/RPB5)
MEPVVERTVREMLADRCYTDIQEGDEPVFFIATKVRSKIVVFYHAKEKLRIEHVRKYQTLLEDEKPLDVIVIHQESITPSAATLLTSLNIIPFHERELWNNLTRHKLYFKHTKLSDEEVLKLLAQYMTTKLLLPMISIHDPVVKYFGWKLGDVVKITRGLGGYQPHTPYYRIVTEMH